MICPSFELEKKASDIYAVHNFSNHETLCEKNELPLQTKTSIPSIVNKTRCDIRVIVWLI